MRIACFGDSLTEGTPGVSFFEALEAMLPEDKLVNFGKGGDTVISLYRRIGQRWLQDSVDIAVLWVGVNDVLAKLSIGHAMLKRLMRQPRASDLAEFSAFYHRTLKLLGSEAGRVLAVSPLLIGEALANPWNRELGRLCEVIASVSASFDAAQYVDLRTCLSEKLPRECASDYLPKSVTSIARDALVLRSPAQVDAVSSRRGLSLTLDGVHLNSTGAEAVAGALFRAIRNHA
jgi:lysophospholipase L1-like esterase